MKCLVINLDRSAARLAHVSAEFARIGVAFERVPAIDGIKRPELASMAGWLTLAEIACFLSHRACWAIIAEGDAPYGAVFEDDIVLSDIAAPLLANTSWIPANADIIKLETFRKTVIAMQQAPAGYGFSVARLHGPHLGTAGYIISKQAARDMLDATEIIEGPVDHVMFDPAFATSLNRTKYQILPALCIQDQFLKGESLGLPSLLNEERHKAGRNEKAVLTKFIREAGRVGRQVSNICRLRREKTIPFEHHGRRIRPPAQSPTLSPAR